MDETKPDRDETESTEDETADDARGGVCKPSKRLSVDDEKGGEDREPTTDDSSEPGSPLQPGTPASQLESWGDPGAGEGWAEAENAADVVDLLDTPESTETKLRWEGPGRLVYQPALHKLGADRYAVRGRREGDPGVPWGFWGGVLFAFVALMALLGAESMYSLWDVAWVVLGLSVGALMYRYGRKSKLEEATLCEVDSRRGVLHWPEGAQSGLGEMRLSFDQITEVVFGMTRLPVTDTAGDVRVDAFALLLRTERDELIPVVEGSPYKGDVHDVARFLADATDNEITYVGRGVRA